MSTMEASGLVCLGLACVSACGDNPPANAPVDCLLEQDRVIIVAEPGELQTDGSVVVYGTVRFAPLYGGEVGGGATAGEAGVGGTSGPAAHESTVRAVYVGTVEAVPAASEFNFRTWTAIVQGDRLQAQDDGTGVARLPVDVYLYGGCVARLDTEHQPAVELPIEGGGGTGGEPSGAGGGGAGEGGGGSGGG